MTSFLHFLIFLFYCNLAELLIFLSCNTGLYFYLMHSKDIYYYLLLDIYFITTDIFSEKMRTLILSSAEERIKRLKLSYNARLAHKLS